MTNSLTRRDFFSRTARTAAFLALASHGIAGSKDQLESAIAEYASTLDSVRTYATKRAKAEPDVKSWVREDRVAKTESRLAEPLDQAYTSYRQIDDLLVVEVLGKEGYNSLSKGNGWVTERNKRIISALESANEETLARIRGYISNIDQARESLRDSSHLFTQKELSQLLIPVPSKGLHITSGPQLDIYLMETKGNDVISTCRQYLQKHKPT